MSHKDAPPETPTQTACREWWQAAQPHITRAWGRAKDGRFLAIESQLLHESWEAAQRGGGGAVSNEAETQALPDGWVAVPVEPDQKMKDAGWSTYLNDDSVKMGNIYRAMLSARLELPKQLLNATESEHARLRAEVEALRDCLRECADDLETEVTARASGELPRRIERDLEPVRKARALLAQRDEWVNPLSAEVEALRADAERYRYLRDSNDFETLAVVADYTPTSEWDRRIDTAIAAQRGEGK